ncbi:MAG: polyprenyl synthetase family protein [Chloroflexota bacterium]|nr:polyprenyl synthetase family protein [Chloroflexota bacterium]
MKTPLRLIPLLEPIRPQMERVECLLHETYAQVEEPLGSMLRCSLSGGKRLRPALVVLVGRMLTSSAPPPNPPVGEESSSAPFHILAAAVEMLHAATLIHDDLLDEAPLRRGRKTLHTVWPSGATVLAGDYLLAQAAALIAETKHPRILKVFAETLCIMCAGEIRQMYVIRGKQSRIRAAVEQTALDSMGRYGREDYYRSIEAKTASLCAAAMEMAGLLAGAGESQIAALRHFGRELGMAFQIVDDVLDFISDETQLGKPAGSDLRLGLITLPTLYYLERTEDDISVNDVLSGQQGEEHVRAAIEAICSSGAIESALAEARAHARQGQEALAMLPDNGSRQMLCSLAKYVVERNR